MELVFTERLCGQAWVFISDCVFPIQNLNLRCLSPLLKVIIHSFIHPTVMPYTNRGIKKTSATQPLFCGRPHCSEAENLINNLMISGSIRGLF